MNRKAKHQCPECNGIKFKMDLDGYVCLDCGLVIPEDYYFEKIAAS